MPNRSTVTNLVYFSQFVSEVIKSKSQADLIYLGFQKAFDQIDHYVLLAKMRSFDFSNSLLNIFKLFNREQCIVTNKYRNFISYFIIPTSGVLQGSNLGPPLFLIFVNNLANNISCEKLMFADDVKLFAPVESVEECQVLQFNIEVYYFVVL